MSESEVKGLGDIQVDEQNLYREESFTDLKVATLRRLSPIKPDGSPDDSRETLFAAETTLMSARGPLPIQTSIEAASLEEAMEKFPVAIQAAVERMIEEAREYQRQEASRIVVPGGAPPPPGKIIT